MPFIDRRSFVAALAASLTSATAAQASGRHSMPEHPDLLAMSDQLPGVLQSYKDAASEVQNIAKTWGPQWPKPNPEIMFGGGFGHRHADILGRGIRVPDKYTKKPIVHYVAKPDELQRRLDGHISEAERTSGFKRKGRMEHYLRMADETRQKIQPSRAYWAEVERITSASGIEAAKAEQERAREALMQLVRRILTFEEQSALGLGIKAQALAAYSELPRLWQALAPDLPNMLMGLSDTLSRRASV